MDPLYEEEAEDDVPDELVLSDWRSVVDHDDLHDKLERIGIAGVFDMSPSSCFMHAFDFSVDKALSG